MNQNNTYSSHNLERKLNLDVLEEETGVVFIFFVDMGAVGFAREGILGDGGTSAARLDGEG